MIKKRSLEAVHRLFMCKGNQQKKRNQNAKKVQRTKKKIFAKMMFVHGCVASNLEGKLQRESISNNGCVFDREKKEEKKKFLPFMKRNIQAL